MPSFSHTPQKNKVVLSDYNYSQDIENRLFLADLSLLEVEVLTELLDGSLKTSLKNLSEAHKTTEINQLKSALEKLGSTKLFTTQGDIITIDKEQRKYYEAQIIKFDDDFKPGMEFLQSLLSKVPIHILPNWYSLSGASDHIFNSIVDKFLLTPKIYERHLIDLKFDDPILNKLVSEIRVAPNFKIYSKDLISKYKLTREQFEEYVLELEFNFVCCLSYSHAENVWEEVLTPFYEWREYLQFLQKNSPHPILDVEKIERTHNHDFGFLLQLNSLLSNIMLKKHQVSNKATAEEKNLIDKLLFLNLIENGTSGLEALSLAAEWLKMPLADQAIVLYRKVLANKELSNSHTDKDLRQIEKNLKVIANTGWIFFDDFKKGFIKPLGNKKPTTLMKTGNRWKFTPPTFTESDFAFIEKAIFIRLYETGMVKTGVYENKRCFSVTSFGRVSLTD